MSETEHPRTVDAFLGLPNHVRKIRVLYSSLACSIKSARLGYLSVSWIRLGRSAGWIKPYLQSLEAASLANWGWWIATARRDFCTPHNPLIKAGKWEFAIWLKRSFSFWAAAESQRRAIEESRSSVTAFTLTSSDISWLAFNGLVS